MKHIILSIIAAAAMLTGCRSDADRMAEFCLMFDNVVQNARNCEQMSVNVGHLMRNLQSKLRERNVCLNGTTACSPCKKAVRTMLGQCGNDPALRPVLDEMHFSESLREQ